MPKVASRRTADPLLGEVSPSKQARMSNPSFPLVPSLSPQQIGEAPSCDIPPDDSPYHAFPLLSHTDDRQLCMASPDPDPICLNRKEEGDSPDQQHPKFSGDDDDDPASAMSLQAAPMKVASNFQEKEDVDMRDGSIKRAVRQSESSQCESPADDGVDESGDTSKNTEPASDSSRSSPAELDISELRYQIITDSPSPNLSTGQHSPAEKETKGRQQPLSMLTSHAQSLNISTSAAAAAATFPLPLSLLSSLSSAAVLTSAATTTTTTTTTSSTSGLTPLLGPSSSSSSSDPLVSLLQQYTAGKGCGTDLSSSLSALHLPLNLASAAIAAAATTTGGDPPVPHVGHRYLYATNPCTGQLLILSHMGDLTSAGAHQGLQPLPLQPQLSLQPVMQFSQQSVKLQDKGWKSPLCLKQCNSGSSCTTTTGPTVGKQVAKPITVVSKLLKSKLPPDLALGPSGQADENTPSVVAARDLLALATTAHAQGKSESGAQSMLFHGDSATVRPKSSEEPVRENHNMKERRRRARIKDACDLMRQLVPGLSEKTDKATVFEFSARYILFLKNFVGTHHDKDFLIKYSPY